MRHLVVYILLLYSSFSVAQKRTIDTSDFRKWTSLGQCQISNDGRHVSHIVKNSPFNSCTLVLQRSDGTDKKDFIGVSKGYFTEDSKAFIYLRGDTIYFLDLIRGGTKWLCQTKNWITQEILTSSWIVYEPGNVSDSLILMNYKTGRTAAYGDVVKYEFMSGGSGILLVTNDKGLPGKISLHLISFNSKKGDSIDDKIIWASAPNSPAEYRIGSWTFDPVGRGIAFGLEESLNGSKKESIWYSNGKDSAIIWGILQATEYHIDIEEEILFNRSGDFLFFRIRKELVEPKRSTNAAAVDVWDYKDEFLISEQPKLNRKSLLLCGISLGSHKIIHLERDTDSFVQFATAADRPVGNYVLCFETKYGADSWWHPNYRQSVFLVSCRDGERYRIIEDSISQAKNIQLSMNEKFIIWYNFKTNKYISYDIEKQVQIEITKDIPYPMYDNEKASPIKASEFGICGWTVDGKYILLYDRFDIWKVDMSGLTQSKCLTNEEGRRHRVVLSLAGKTENKLIDEEEVSVISGFNRETKMNGLMSFKLGDKGFSIKQMLLGPYSYCIPRTVPHIKGRGTVHEDISAGRPVKATEADIYIVYRMSERESINLFVTKDFLKFTKISDIKPEDDFNWLTAELHRWHTLDGKIAKGILYKPENFDSTKMYPVIFNYYEEKTDGLRMYMQPRLSQATLNIPYYVSNGYLVFVPDIYYEKGYVGQGALNSLESAANYLSSFRWVDSAHMGLQGQSFGGYETNYLITRSQKFAAACEGSGVSNVISAYGQLSNGSTCEGSGTSRQSLYEIDQSYIGTTPWERPDLYVENTVIFKLGNVTTPLLIWHSKDDVAVPFEQAIELYLGLRRAGKKVWLLQYDGGGHATSGKNAVDLTVRMKQFFDHYLMGSPPPAWMTKGRPQLLKQVDDRYELDRSGAVP